jgi:hypothetical protein
MLEPRDALRDGLQAGFRAPESFHQAEGRHQRLRGSFQPVPWAI